MKITFILNDNEITVDERPESSMLSILRQKILGDVNAKTKIALVKEGCKQGHCGACTILLNGMSVPSCIVPLSAVKDKSVVTLDHFQKSKMYQCIVAGFQQADIHLCGYCDAGKVFAARDVLEGIVPLEREDILRYVSHLSPCCVDYESLTTGILCSYELWSRVEKGLGAK